MSDTYAGPDRRRKPPVLYVPNDLDGIREVLSEHLTQEADMREHFDAKFEGLHDLLKKQIDTTATISPAVDELKSILTGFRFLKKTAIVIASIVGLCHATWEAVKDYIK